MPIPAGVADGQTLRLSLGQGQELFVTVRVEESDYFRWFCFLFVLLMILVILLFDKDDVSHDKKVQSGETARMFTPRRPSRSRRLCLAG